MSETPGSDSVSTKLQRIAELARTMPGAALTTLSHYIDIELLREAYRKTRKDGATGVDDMTAKEYASKLDERVLFYLWCASCERSGSATTPKFQIINVGGLTRGST